jgi:hypothetical protein
MMYLELYIDVILPAGMWWKGEMCTWFWWGSLRERDHWGDPDLNGRIILRWISGSGRGLLGLDGTGSG